MFAFPARYHRLIVEQFMILHREEDFEEIIAEQIAHLLARGEAIDGDLSGQRGRLVNW